jgi:cysteine desulfurase
VTVNATYLDHAATTPPRPEARAAWTAWVDAANASSSHAAGQRARAAVEEAREQVAVGLRCSPHEVVFTSGGTEADNLALKGIVWAARDRHAATPHVVTTAVEHPAVLEVVGWLAARGDATVTVVPPDPDGTVPVDRVLDAVVDGTVLVSVMAANNELGAVNDLAALGDALADRPVALHTDAVQAMATLDVDVAAWGVDALALSAHKFGGPQGVGVAVLRRGLPVEPLLHGGGQDRGVRSGTFAVAMDAACGAAVDAAVADRARSERGCPGSPTGWRPDSSRWTGCAATARPTPPVGWCRTSTCRSTASTRPRSPSGSTGPASPPRPGRPAVPVRRRLRTSSRPAG